MTVLNDATRIGAAPHAKDTPPIIAIRKNKIFTGANSPPSIMQVNCEKARIGFASIGETTQTARSIFQKLWLNTI
jgi:hypothetical protein